MSIFLRLESLTGATVVQLPTLPISGIVYEPPRVTVGEIQNRWDGLALIHSVDVPTAYRDVGRVLTMESTQSGNRIEGSLTTAQKQVLEAFLLEHFAGFKVFTNMLEPALDGETFRLVPGTFVNFVSVVPSREHWAWSLAAVRVAL